MRKTVKAFRRAAAAARLCLSAALACLGAYCANAAAAYPDKPVRIVVGTVAGTSIDGVARMVAQKLTDALGQPFLVYNSGGAGGVIATSMVAKSPPDGYTIFLAHNSHPLSPYMNAKLDYDPVKDFSGISLAGTQPLVLLTRLDLPANSVADVIKLSQQKPGGLNVGTAGIGSPAHLSGAMFAEMTHSKLAFIAYKGAPLGLSDLVGGQLDLYFGTIPTGYPLVRSGKLRALAVTSTKRSPVVPDLPTLVETGVAGYDFVAWFGFLAPAKTPADIIARLNSEIARAMQSPEIRDKLLSQGVEPTVSTPAELDRRIESEFKNGAAIAKAAGIKPE